MSCRTKRVFRPRGATPSAVVAGDKRYRHGYGRTLTYRSWEAAKARCSNPANNHFSHYGARGIEMCAEWRTDFRAFLRDMGPRPKGHTLDRISNDGPYSPANCRWATPSQQQLNTTRNHRLTIESETLTLTEWGARIGVTGSTVRKRLKRGWSDAQAVGVESR